MLARAVQQASDLCSRALLHPAVFRGSSPVLHKVADPASALARCRGHGSTADPNAEKCAIVHPLSESVHAMLRIQTWRTQPTQSNVNYTAWMLGFT